MRQNSLRRHPRSGIPSSALLASNSLNGPFILLWLLNSRSWAQRDSSSDISTSIWGRSHRVPQPAVTAKSSMPLYRTLTAPSHHAFETPYLPLKTVHITQSSTTNRQWRVENQLNTQSYCYYPIPSLILK
jgi:hypothetical protein